MDHDAYRRKLQYRSWHRGTREADAMVGGYFDHYSADWTPEQYAWFEILLEEQDVDIMAWAFGTAPPKPELNGPMMDLLRRLDFITLPAGLSEKI